MKRLGERALVAMVVMCLIAPVLLVRTGSPAGASALRQDEASPLDIASIALRPSDLGVEGFTIGNGQMWTLEDQAAEEGVAVEDLIDAGQGRYYLESIGLPPAGESDCHGQVISTWIYESPDDDAAGEQFEETIDFFESEDAEILDDDVRIGDAGFLVSYPLSDGGCGDGDEGEGMQIVFQVDRLVVHVWLFNNHDPEMVPEDAYPIDPETLLELGGIAEEKAFAALDGESANPMEPVVLRLGDGETVYGSAFDDYLRIDGETFLFDRESDENREARIAHYGDATAIYQVAQPFENEDDEELLFINTHYQFEDEDTASEWMAGAEDRMLEDDRYEDVGAIRLAEEFGDESIGLTVFDTKLETELTRVYARYGSLVVVISVGAPDAADDAAVSLMESQATCIADGACAAAVPFPAY